MSKLKSAKACLLLTAAAIFVCQGCGEITGPSFPVIASPRVIITTPSSPASDKITIRFQLIDREKESGDVTVEYSTDGAQTFQSATLTAASQVTGLASDWYPGIIHTVQWDSVTDMVGISGDAQVCIKVTPSDASNPSGTADTTGTFTVDNLAFNQSPTATVSTPAGVQSGNVQITYTLTDTEGDTCSIVVEFSVDGGAYQTATMGPAGDGLSGLPSSPGGTQHTFLWDSRADNVALLAQQDNVRVRITPTDFHTGAAVATNPFSVDNSVPNNPPTVSIISGPANGSTIYTDQVTFVWSGNDTDGSIDGYYYSFDRNPPDVWTASTSVTSGILTQSPHTFRVIAMDDDGDFSTVVSRTFTVSAGFIQANFSASPLTGTAPLSVQFTNLSTSTSGITSWSWSFGDGGSSTAQNPQHTYSSTGTYTVTLTVSGPDGSDTETKVSYITVTIPGGNTIYVDGTGGNDTNSGFSWVAAVKTIQTGLDKAGANGWTVLVANGTYTGTGNKDLDFTGKAIHLKSVGGAENCIIDCQSSGRGFYFHSGETNAAILEGFTVRNGRLVSGHGAGIRCANASSPTIRYCVIQDCHVQSGSEMPVRGGGIDCNSSSPIITNCTIENNSGMATVKMSNAEGGGISCNQSNAVIANCTINNNSVTATTTLSTADGAGIWCDESDVTIINCTIANNSAFGEPMIATAMGRGGGLDCFKCNPVLNNCIIWGNTARWGSQIQAAMNSVVTLNHCDLPDDTQDPERIREMTSAVVDESNNCIHLDPMFVNATAQDYHLQDTSPCIDAGGNSYVTGITTDLDGNPRIANTTVDIGAYEYAVARNWIQKFPANKPVAREFHSMAYDSSRGVVVLFGGSPSVGSYLDDTWEYDGINWVRSTPANKPPAREHHSMVYDSSRSVVVLFSGRDNSGYLDDTWEYDGTSWAQRNPANKPVARRRHSMVYDSGRGVVVLFGGWDGSNYLNDTWEYNGTNWVQKSPTNRPSERYLHSLAYDSSHGVVVLFGGWSNSGRFDDTWEYGGTDWVQRSPVNKPPARYNHSMAYDSSRGVVVLFGGWRTGTLDDTWEYDGANWLQKSPANKPPARRRYSIVYDSDRGVVVLFGGDGSGYLDDTWEY